MPKLTEHIAKLIDVRAHGVRPGGVHIGLNNSSVTRRHSDQGRGFVANQFRLQAPAFPCIVHGGGRVFYTPSTPSYTLYTLGTRHLTVRSYEWHCPALYLCLPVSAFVSFLLDAELDLATPISYLITG